MKIRALGTAALSAILLAGASTAQDIRPADLDRLAAFDEFFGMAVRDALAEGAPNDVAILLEALSGPAGPLAPEGEWNCRTIKMGNLLPLVVYSNFRCRIEPDDHMTYRLVKLTGSQRLEGTIYDGGAEALFLGVGHVGDAPDLFYHQFPPTDQTPIGANQTTPDVGLFEQMGPNRARLMFPAPILESEFDILYLTR